PKSINESKRVSTNGSKAITNHPTPPFKPIKSPIHLIRWSTHHPITPNQPWFLHINPLQQILHVEPPHILGSKWAARPCLFETPPGAHCAIASYTSRLALGGASGARTAFGINCADGTWRGSRHRLCGRRVARRA